MGRRTPNKVRMMEGEDVRTAVRVHLSKTVCMCAVAGKGYKEHPAIETNVIKCPQNCNTWPVLYTWQLSHPQHFCQENKSYKQGFNHNPQDRTYKKTLDILGRYQIHVLHPPCSSPLFALKCFKVKFWITVNSKN